MRTWTPIIGAILAAAFLAGCATNDEPQASTEAAPPTGTPLDVEPSNDTGNETTAPASPPPTTAPAPAEDLALQPVPPGEEIIFHPDPAPIEPAAAPVDPTPPETADAEGAPDDNTTDPPQDDSTNARADDDAPADAETPDTGGDPAWPTEGSFVRYRVVMFESIPGSTDDSGADTSTELTWTYRDDDWHGTCEGEERARSEGETTVTDIKETYEASDPPHWPPFNTRDVPDEGEDVEAWFVKGCDILSLDRAFAGTDGAMYVATDHDDGSPDDFRTEWSREWGIVTMWDWSQRDTNTRGELTATDAPGL